LERIVLGRTLSPAAAAALGVTPPSTADAVASNRATLPWDLPREQQRSGSDQSRRALDQVELWHHIRLLPGLELMVSSRASPGVQSAAKRICDEFVG
jgi:hypothetical protein